MHKHCFKSVVLVVLYAHENVQRLPQSNLLNIPTKANKVTGSTMVFLRLSEIPFFTYRFFKTLSAVQNCNYQEARSLIRHCSALLRCHIGLLEIKSCRIYQVRAGANRDAKNTNKIRRGNLFSLE